MGSELIFRGHETQPMADGYSPKPPKPWLSVVRPIRYMLREQRLLFTLVGIAIATVVFLLLPSSPAPYTHRFDPISDSYFPSETTTQLAHRVAYAGHGGGGFGFVNSGGRLIRRGDSVIVVDNFFTGRKENVMHHFGNPRFELIRHDVVEPLLLEVDQIYHLACPASPFTTSSTPSKPSYPFSISESTNVVGTLNMLGLAKRVGARFLLTSTSEVYGDPSNTPRWRPTGATSTPSVRIARIFNTYGPRMCIDDGRVVSNFVAQALRKEPLTVYGDGKQTRSFQYVLIWLFSVMYGTLPQVEGLIRLMEGEHVGPFNLGNPGEFTMLELAQVVQETIDPNAKIEFRPNTEDDPHKRKPDISKAKDLLGWEPKVALRKGLPLWSPISENASLVITRKMVPLPPHPHPPRPKLTTHLTLE
ncbi:UDP-glucuronic acid decarboxylase 2 [Vitis vinifera]|uniref:UDP-glucuronate decarboxylase n=1 Tax=Vitis vinifera TaxID=29760 RepID=A0A438F3D9_VITVI|nr:UDP-glucuronic acid decarboxylase 2 [Vitis vinifera]